MLRPIRATYHGLRGVSSIRSWRKLAHCVATLAETCSGLLSHDLFLCFEHGHGKLALPPSDAQGLRFVEKSMATSQAVTVEKASLEVADAPELRHPGSPPPLCCAAWVSLLYLLSVLSPSFRSHRAHQRLPPSSISVSSLPQSW